ncbi:MAG: 1-aminocyclopropane-1-carboxylate deaminase/D-cysteine desulfhydrase [Candidatus Hodarchaeota archaeon]
MIGNPLDIENIDRPLLDAFPGLKKLPWMPLMDGIPTPVEKLENISKNFPGYHVWIKRDDLTSTIYGGNKPRKFEFLFANALKKKKKEIITAGGIGTNHGLASTLFCDRLGLKSKLYLFDQPLTSDVQKKLLIYLNFDVKLHLIFSYFMLVIYGMGEAIAHPKSYLMLPGGSSLFGLGTGLGGLGFVNAGFELKEQVDKSLIPEPDYIFIASASTGSAAGLILGCKMAGLKTKVVSVQVSEPILTNPSAILSNIKKINKVIKKVDPKIENVKITYPEDFLFVKGFLGEKYGCVTEHGLKAIEMVKSKEGDKGFKLDTSYTGKAFAAMLDFMEKNPESNDKNVLFWNTYNSRDLTELVEKSNNEFEKLPKSFHKYFKEFPFSQEL